MARSAQETTTRENCEKKEEREGVLTEEKRTGEAQEGPKEEGTGPEERWEVVGGRWQLRRQLDSSIGARNSSSIPTVHANQMPKKVVWLEEAVEEGLPGLRDESKWPAADDNDLDLFMTTDGGGDGGDISGSGGGRWKQVVGTTDQWEVQRRDTRAVPSWSNNGAAEEDDEGAAAWEPSRQPPPARSGRFFKEDEQRADLADNIIEDKRIKPGKNKGDEESEEGEEASSEENEEKKPPKLNVSDKDSPYALLDKYFPERESYFYQNRHSFKNLHREGGGRAPEIGNLQPKEVNTLPTRIIKKTTRFCRLGLFHPLPP